MRSDQTNSNQTWTAEDVRAALAAPPRATDFRSMDRAAFERWADAGRRRMLFHTDRQRRLTFEDVSGDMLRSWNTLAPGAAAMEDAEPSRDTMNLEARTYREPRRGRAPGPAFSDTRQRADIQRMNAASQMKVGGLAGAMAMMQKGLELAQKYYNRQAIIAALERLSPSILAELERAKDPMSGVLVSVHYRNSSIRDVQVVIQSSARLVRQALATYEQRLSGGTISAPDACVRLVWVERIL